jgi:NAD+ kinase
VSAPRVVVVTKRSLYGRYVEDEDDPRVQLLVRRRDRSVAHWLDAHEQHERTREAVRELLEKLGARVLVVRNPGAQFDPTDAVLVITVGGDGTLLAASHNVKNVPILGVNSAPRYSVGSYCAARRSNLGQLLPAALAGTLRGVTLTRMRVALNGRTRSRRILNEALFCHSTPAATSRYILSCRGIAEEQRTSGFWIGPAAGSGAAQRSAGGKVLPLTSRKLQLVVREPYLPPGKRYRLLRLLLGPTEKVSVKSNMQSGCIFLDGPYKRVPVRLGDRATFTADGDPLRVLGLRGRRAQEG